MVPLYDAFISADKLVKYLLYSFLRVDQWKMAIRSPSFEFHLTSEEKNPMSITITGDEYS